MGMLTRSLKHRRGDHMPIGQGTALQSHHAVMRSVLLAMRRQGCATWQSRQQQVLARCSPHPVSAQLGDKQHSRHSGAQCTRLCGLLFPRQLQNHISTASWQHSTAQHSMARRTSYAGPSSRDSSNPIRLPAAMLRSSCSTRPGGFWAAAASLAAGAL